MYKDLTVGAIVVAAGKGTRMGNDINKQYLIIGDKPVLAHTLLAINETESIDKIVVVTRQDEIEYCMENIIKKYDISKAIKVIPGGRERQDSMINGLNALNGMCDIVVTHDGARPFVTHTIIENSIYEAYVHGAAACAVPVKDTIKVLGDGGFIADTPERTRLYAVQTPQTFKFDILYKAHISAEKQGYTGTDDTVLVERIGLKVKLFKGSYENIKITTPEDIYMGEAILRYRKDKYI